MCLMATLCVMAVFTGCSSSDNLRYLPYGLTPVESEAPAVSETPTPVISEAPAETQAPVASEAPAETLAPVTSEAPAATEDMHSGSAQKDPDAELLEALAAFVGVKSSAERNNADCVVDMRYGHDIYDISWDYGFKYDGYVGKVDWSTLFDAGYYMEQFPMLALQYHYDEAKLLRHFQTVGIHEGRQGNERFNVGAFMDWCDAEMPYVRETLQDEYAVYYMFYALSSQDLPDSFRADGRPAQYAVVMSIAQKTEFDAVNAYRKTEGLGPYIYDPELAAFANYRAWVNQDQALVGHEWLQSGKNQDVMDLYFAGVDTELISENCLETGSAMPKVWARSYAGSKSHYDAMVSTKYAYYGGSNLYVSDVPYGTKGYRGVQFDIFTDSLSTAVNP